MQSKTFSRISTAIVVIGAIYVVLKLSGDAQERIPFPDLNLDNFLPVATSTLADESSTTTPAQTDLNELLRLKNVEIHAPTGKISAEISADDDSRSLGLSFRENLPKDSGMLFVFPNAGVFGFWMKDMKFPIDLIWIGADKKVIGVVPSIPADSYPAIFYPEQNISYVLELNSEGAQSFGIATGTQLVF